MSLVKGEKMAEWEKQIDGVIGDGEKPFGDHPSDSKAARKMLVDAISEGEGFNSYYDKMVKAYRKKLPSTPEGADKLSDQMKRVKSLDSYFDHD